MDFQTLLSEAEQVLAGDVTPEHAEEVNRLFGKAMSASWTDRAAQSLGEKIAQRLCQRC